MTPGSGPDEVPPRPPLTVGLAIASRHVPSWLADVISAIEDAGDAVVVDMIVTGVEAAPRLGGLGRALLGVYDRVDGRVFGRAGDPTRMVDLQRPTTPSDPRSPGAAEAIDMVLRLDGGGSAIDRWPAPEFGVWTLEHGMGLPPAARPAGLGLVPGGSETLLRRSTTISQLVATMGADRRVIGQVVSGADRLSMRRGARGHTVKLASLVARTIAAVRAHRTLPQPVVESFPGEAPSARGEAIGVGTILLGMAQVVSSYVGGLLRRKLAPERWVVAISREQRDPRGREGPPFHFLEAPEGREWADPFPVDTPLGELLFVEEYVRNDHKGRLAVVRLDDSPRGWRSVETVLDLPTHLSYPFVFRFEDDWYMLPEQAGTGALQLYVAEEFPTRWHWHSTALDLPASDATLIEIDGRWWMFAALMPKGGTTADELHIFHAASPLGPWIAHVRNPVVSDIRSARPAGRVYRMDGVWYRAAQDGAVTYGHSVCIVRIDRIDMEDYRETVVDVIRPYWAPGLMATHTLNHTDDVTAVDALRLEPRVRLRGPRPGVSR